MSLWAAPAGDVAKRVKAKRCTSEWLHYGEEVRCGVLLRCTKIRHAVYVCNKMVIHKICSVYKVLTAGYGLCYGINETSCERDLNNLTEQIAVQIAS